MISGQGVRKRSTTVSCRPLPFSSARRDRSCGRGSSRARRDRSCGRGSSRAGRGRSCRRGIACPPQRAALQAGTRPARQRLWTRTTALRERIRLPRFQYKPGPLIAAESPHQPGHQFAQHGLQRPGWIEDKHAAAVQPKAVRRRRADRQGDMQPVLGFQALEAFRQAARFQPLQHRIPDRIRTGGKALQRIFQSLGDVPVVILVFVRWIDQHQAAARGRRQQGLESGKAVGPIDDDPLATPGAVLPLSRRMGFQLAEIIR